MKRASVLVGTTIVAAALLVALHHAFGADHIAFALGIVWLPMTWLGTISHVIPLRLPSAYHRLRRFEEDGRIYEFLGVRAVKRLLRRRPFSIFNPGLHLPTDPTANHIARLERRMCTAETSHGVLFVVTLLVTGYSAARGWWLSAAATLVFNILINGYPVMLQRYNRALLRMRFAQTLD